jgi:hypothetical protein
LSLPNLNSLIQTVFNTTFIKMLGRTIFAATFVALAQFAVAAPPPGCLLGAVNQYKDPVDIQAVCKAKDLSSKVAEICGDETEAAMSALAEICGDVDVEICKFTFTFLLETGDG